jgi:hypothetical protein
MHCTLIKYRHFSYVINVFFTSFLFYAAVSVFRWCVVFLIVRLKCPLRSLFIMGLQKS